VFRFAGRRGGVSGAAMATASGSDVRRYDDEKANGTRNQFMDRSNTTDSATTAGGLC
jgi:hypothetical protein